MNSILKLSFFTIMILFLLGCVPESSKRASFRATIIHINDHHSHIDSDKMTLRVDGKEIETQIGGFAKVVSKIKSIQQNSINPITLHAGDALQGSMYYTLFKSKIDAKVINQIRWDAFTLGNHEFDDGDKELSKFLSAINAPIVSANVIANRYSPLYQKWKPYRIIKRENQKIAIIGLESSFKTKYSSNPSSHITFLDELATLKKYVKEIEAQGVNKIILLSHFGFENDQKLAKAITGIDVIIDGDSHTLMGEFNIVGLKSVDSYPKIVKSKDNHPICIAQAWQYSYIVGKLNVAFDSDGIITSCQGTPTLLLETTNPKLIALAKQYPQLEVVKPDKQTNKIIQKYKKELDTKKSQIVAISKTYIGHNRIPLDRVDGVSSLKYGSDIAPLIAKSFYLKSTRANCAIQNAGGVRSGVKKANISIDDIYKLLPFSNTLIELTMSGKEIKNLLEDAISAVFDNHSTGAFPYGYAIRYDIDTHQSKGNRVKNIEIMNAKTQKFMPLDNQKKYVVVTNSYIAEGKDGYTTFKSIKSRVDTYYDYAMSFSDMLKKDKYVTPLKRYYHPIKSFD